MIFVQFYSASNPWSGSLAVESPVSTQWISENSVEEARNKRFLTVILLHQKSYSGRALDVLVFSAFFAAALFLFMEGRKLPTGLADDEAEDDDDDEDLLLLEVIIPMDCVPGSTDRLFVFSTLVL
jgi:hypothetical protein